MAREVTEDVIATAAVAFKSFLRDRNLKFTAERESILRAVLSTDEHFEAEQLLLRMRQDARPVGKATVYRTLKLLVECGIVKQVQFSNKQVHYEHVYDQAAHDHMVCKRCGRIIEFDAREVERLREGVAKEFNFHAVAHRFQILGLCEHCVGSCPVGPLVDEIRRESLD